MTETTENTKVAVCAETIFEILVLVKEIMGDIKAAVKSEDPPDRSHARWQLLFGEKENVVSLLVKLAGVLSKIIPMELKLMTIVNKSEEKKVKEISQEDADIIKRYLQKIKNGGAVIDAEAEELLQRSE